MISLVQVRIEFLLPCIKLHQKMDFVGPFSHFVVQGQYLVSFTAIYSSKLNLLSCLKVHCKGNSDFTPKHVLALSSNYCFSLHSSKSEYNRNQYNTTDAEEFPNVDCCWEGISGRLGPVLSGPFGSLAGGCDVSIPSLQYFYLHKGQHVCSRKLAQKWDGRSQRNSNETVRATEQKRKRIEQEKAESRSTVLSSCPALQRQPAGERYPKSTAAAGAPPPCAVAVQKQNRIRSMASASSATCIVSLSRSLSLSVFLQSRRRSAIRALSSAFAFLAVFGSGPS